jgi:hypothetical protein
MVMRHTIRSAVLNGFAIFAFAGLAQVSEAMASPVAAASVVLDYTRLPDLETLNNYDGLPQITRRNGTHEFNKLVDTNCQFGDGYCTGRGDFGAGLTVWASGRAGDRYAQAKTEALLDEFGIIYLSSSAGWTTSAVPGGSGRANVVGHFNGKTTINDSLDFAQRIADINAAYQANKSIYPAPPVDYKGRVIGAETTMSMRLLVGEMETGNWWQSGRVDDIQFGYYLSQQPVLGVGCDAFGFSAGDYCVTDHYGEAVRFLYQESSVDGKYSFTPRSTDFPFTTASLKTSGITPIAMTAIPFDSSRTYYISLEVMCQSSVFASPGISTGTPSISTSCLADKSAYWMGLSDFTNTDGNPIAPFTLTEIGTGRSLNSPSPFAPGAVPEPATWAMLIAGFGLVGGSARRRRRTAFAIAASSGSN